MSEVEKDVRFLTTVSAQQNVVTEFMQSAAGGLFAGVLLILFRQRTTVVFGDRPWTIVGLAALVSLLQAAALLCDFTARPGLARANALAAAACALALAAGVGPFLLGAKMRIAAVIEDVARGRIAAAEAKAMESLRWLELAENIAQVGHWRIDLPDYKLFWSDQIYHIHGRAKAAGVPDIKTAICYFHQDDRARIEAHIDTAIAERSGYEFEARLIRADDETRFVLSRGVVECDALGEVTGIFGVFLDITEQKRLENRLRRDNDEVARANGALLQLALADGLTGLPNRRAFDTALDREFRRALRGRTTLALMMIDLDHFKSYNDRYGHPAGDSCLRRVAAAIAAVPQRPGDLVARYGGEELVVLLPDTDEAGACRMAGQVLAAVRALAIPHSGNPHNIVTISGGVAVFDSRLTTGAALDLLERADRALYRAKLQDRNQVVYDKPTLVS